MKKHLKTFKHKGEKYEIMLVKRPDEVYFLKDFNGNVPFSPFYHCVSDLGFIDIDEIDARLDQPIMKHLITQTEEAARFWADNKHKLLGFMPN